MIHITDGQQDNIIGVITPSHIIDNTHRQSLKDTLETFDFVTFADKAFSEHLGKHNRVIIPAEDTGYKEFVINESIKRRNADGLEAEVYASATYLLLKKAKVIDPQILTEYTPSMFLGWTLNGTEWRPGIVEGSGYRTLTIDSHTNPYNFLKRVANEFDLELRFRVETDGNRITGRYVDLLERVGQWQGREVELGKDLQGIRRIEKTDNIYTALRGIGPEREDGTRLEVLVEDEEALQRWGRPNDQGVLQHLIDVYEPQSERMEMTEEELTQYTRTELNKRINEVVEYEVDIADLEHVPGLANKKIRFGDTIKIKDTKFNPPLYLEARVHTQERNIIDRSQKRVELGDFIEYTEEEVQAIWQQLQAEIRRKASIVDLIEYTYDKITIDRKDEVIFEDGKSFAELIGVDAKEHADIVAIDAENRANNHADNVARLAEENAKIYAEDRSAESLLAAMAYAVAQEAYDNKMQEIANDLADRTTIEYVNGQLVDKANVGDVYTIEEVDTRLLNYVGVIQYETDMDGIVQTLSNQNTTIGQNEEAIALKANQTELDAVANTVSDHSAQIVIMADEISQRVTRTEFENLSIGGRNYLIDSNFTHDTDYWVFYTGSGGEGSVRKVGDVLVIEGVRGSNGPYSRSGVNRPTFYRGDVITVSAWLRGQGTIRIGLNSVSVNAIDVNSPNEFIRISHTFSINVDSVTNAFTFYGQDNCYFEISHVKVEKGNRATDWTPAPEDLDYRMTHVETEIIQTAEAIESRATKTELDAVEGRVESAEGSLTVMSEQIASRVTNTEFEAGLNKKGKLFRAVARSWAGGGNNRYPVNSGLHDEEGNHINYENAPTSSNDRSYILYVMNRSTENWVLRKLYDVYTSADEASRLANDLSQYDENYLVVLIAGHSPERNRLSGGLPQAIYRCGGSSNVFDGEGWGGGATYILIGIPNMGEGAGLEYFRPVGTTVNYGGWLDITFTVKDGTVDFGNSDGSLALSRVRNAESIIEQNADAITQRVTVTNFNNTVNDLEGEINQRAREYNVNFSFNASTDYVILLCRSDQTGINNFAVGTLTGRRVSGYYSSGEVKVVFNNSSTGNAPSGYFEAIDIQYTNTWQMVTCSYNGQSYVGLRHRPNNQYGLWNTDCRFYGQIGSSGEMLLPVETSNLSNVRTFNSVGSVSSPIIRAESQITQLADEIDLKVSEEDFNGNEIIGRINLTSTTARIQAENIELVGAVSVLSDITGNLGTITAGTINGTVINGGQISGTNIVGSEFESAQTNNDGSFDMMLLSQASLIMAHSDSRGRQIGLSQYRATDFFYQAGPELPYYTMNSPEIRMTGRLFTNNNEQVESIVSQGTNADGRWIRYSSGKQEVWCNPVSMSATVSSGNIFRSETVFVSFPQSFNTNFPIAVSTHTTGNLRWADTAGSPGANSVSIRQYSTISGSGSISTWVYAVGRWR